LFCLLLCVCCLTAIFVCITAATENNSEQTAKTTQKHAQHYHKTRRKIIQHPIHTPKPPAYRKTRNKNRQTKPYAQNTPLNTKGKHTKRQIQTNPSIARTKHHGKNMKKPYKHNTKNTEKYQQQTYYFNNTKQTSFLEDKFLIEGSLLARKSWFGVK
jgi:hypothetical protein